MEREPFEELLSQIAQDMVDEIENGKPVNRENLLFILRKWFNPFPSAPRDTFASLLKMPGQR